MNCKNCGLPIEEGKEFIAQYQTRWRHKSQDGGMTKFYSCAYANRFEEGSPDLKYEYPTVVATPENDTDVALEFAQKVAGILTSIKEPVAEKIITVKVLPPVVGRRFR
jgi:hypothetical protein